MRIVLTVLYHLCVNFYVLLIILFTQIYVFCFCMFFNCYLIFLGECFICGFDDFYSGLVNDLNQLIHDLPIDNFLDEGCKKIQAEIADSDILKI